MCNSKTFVYRSAQCFYKIYQIGFNAYHHVAIICILLDKAKMYASNVAIYNIYNKMAQFNVYHSAYKVKCRIIIVVFQI